MIWDSTDSMVERGGCAAAAVDLRSRATHPNLSGFSPSTRIKRTSNVSIGRPWRSRIPRNRESAKCGTGFAVVLDRRDSRLAGALVHEETEE
jgi:hypothetical protein